MYGSSVQTITQQAPLSFLWISQATMLEQVAVSFSRGSSQPEIESASPSLAGGIFFFFFFFLPLSHQGSPNIQVTYAILIFSVVQISPYSKLLCRLNTILINIYWVFYRYMVSLFKTCMEIQGKFNFKRNLVKE